MAHASPALLLITLISIALTTSAHVCVLRDAPDLPPQSLPDQRVNDDYCDCDDASDENRTSACPNGFFVCENRQHRPVQIFSSWVHDGSCDCCDGSDEPPGACADTCAALRAEHVKEATRKAETVRRGIAVSKKYERDVDRDRKKEQLEFSRLDRQLASIERQLKSHEKRAQVLRQRRDWEDGMRQATSDDSPSSYGGASAGDSDGEGDDDYKYDEDGVDDDNAEDGFGGREEEEGKEELFDERVDEEEEEQEDEEGGEEEGFDEGADEDYGRGWDEAAMGEDADEQYIEDVAEQGEGEEGSGGDAGMEELAAEAEHSSENEDGWTLGGAGDEESENGKASSEWVDVDFLCAELESNSPSWVVRRLLYMRSLVLNKMKRFLPGKLKSSFGKYSLNLSECISKAESAKWELDSKKRDIKEKMEKLKKKDTIDYGAHKALRKLHGSCTKGKVTQYEFEICMFDVVRQYENGASIAQLGRFDGWKGGEKGRVMKYSNGDRCWNGPQRSITVELVCSDTEEVVSVDEPNRCTYRMVFKTAAVCEESMIEDMMGDLGSVGGGEHKQEL